MIKVIHILNHLEKIDRDINEIEQMRNQLQLDRTYTAVVQESLNTEMSRLTKLQNTIGSLIINNPPAHLVLDLDDHSRGMAVRSISQLASSEKLNKSAPKIEISIPNKQNTDQPENKSRISTENKDSQNLQPRKQAATTSKKKSSNSKRDNTEFQWKFIQK